MQPPTDPPPPRHTGAADETPEDDPVAAVETRQGRRSTVVDFLTSAADLFNPWT